MGHPLPPELLEQLGIEPCADEDPRLYDEDGLERAPRWQDDDLDQTCEWSGPDHAGEFRDRR